MGSVIPLKKSANSAYLELKNLLGYKLQKVESLIEQKLKSDVDLIEKMSDHHLKSGGKRLRALLTLESAKLTGYKEDNRDINLAACVELIHSATLLHDDVIDESSLRRGVKTTNSIWGNQSSILVGDYLLSRCFEIMVQDGDLELLHLLSSTSTKIAQGEVLQLQHKGDSEMLEETYLNIISSKTVALFSASSKVGSIITDKDNKFKDLIIILFYNISSWYYQKDLYKFSIFFGSEFCLYHKLTHRGYGLSSYCFFTDVDICFVIFLNSKI